MGERESVKDMFTRFTHITNELKSLRKKFTTEENAKNSKNHVSAFGNPKLPFIEESKQMSTMQMDEIIETWPNQSMMKRWLCSFKVQKFFKRKTQDSTGLAIVAESSKKDSSRDASCGKNGSLDNRLSPLGEEPGEETP
ncbi:hypothetical protein HAX54_032735 [Datura stramonium]|uniref:Uncharacterized protein n=1 Tax=Datura stramonium TaxID=4076 RepID=A0ABS8SD20_DATST|nr:hypothetical protein [Datura stramonium]